MWNNTAAYDFPGFMVAFVQLCVVCLFGAKKKQNYTTRLSLKGISVVSETTVELYQIRLYSTQDRFPSPVRVKFLFKNNLLLLWTYYFSNFPLNLRPDG